MSLYWTKASGAKKESETASRWETGVDVAELGGLVDSCMPLLRGCETLPLECSVGEYTSTGLSSIGRFLLPFAKLFARDVM